MNINLFDVNAYHFWDVYQYLIGVFYQSDYKGNFPPDMIE